MTQQEFNELKCGDCLRHPGLEFVFFINQVRGEGIFVACAADKDLMPDRTSGMIRLEFNPRFTQVPRKASR